MSKKAFTFTVDVEVDDEEVLFDHAMKVATTASVPLTEDNARSLLRPNGHIDVRNCVQMVLDPGESPPGMSLIESSVYQDAESIFNVNFGDERN